LGISQQLALVRLSGWVGGKTKIAVATAGVVGDQSACGQQTTLSTVSLAIVQKSVFVWVRPAEASASQS